MLTIPTAADLVIIHAVQSALPAWEVTAAKIIKVIAMPEYWAVIGLGVSWWLIQRKKSRSALIILWLTIGNVITPVLKIIFHTPRPTADLVAVYAHESSYGFPSGHALGAAIMVALVWWWTKKWKKQQRAVARIAVVVMALTVGWSRVALGVHWPTDVLAGWVIGAVWGFGVITIFGKGKKQ